MYEVREKIDICFGHESPDFDGACEHAESQAMKEFGENFINVGGLDLSKATLVIHFQGLCQIIPLYKCGGSKKSYMYSFTAFVDDTE